MSRCRDIKAKCCVLTACSLCDAPKHCADAQSAEIPGPYAQYDASGQALVRGSITSLMKTALPAVCSTNTPDPATPYNTGAPSGRQAVQLGDTVQQLADFRFACAAIGARFKSPADGFDIGRTLEDFGRDLPLPNAKAGANDGAHVCAVFARLTDQQRPARTRRDRVFRKQAGQP